MPTRATTLKHVFDIIDLPEESRKYLIEKEGLRNVTALAQNTNAQFIGIRNRSNDVIHHSTHTYRGRIIQLSNCGNFI